MLNPHLGEEHLFFELERNVLPEEDNSVLFFIVFWLLINILYILLKKSLETNSLSSNINTRIARIKFAIKESIFMNIFSACVSLTKISTVSFLLIKNDEECRGSLRIWLITMLSFDVISFLARIIVICEISSSKNALQDRLDTSFDNSFRNFDLTFHSQVRRRFGNEHSLNGFDVNNNIERHNPCTNYLLEFARFCYLLVFLFGNVIIFTETTCTRGSTPWFWTTSLVFLIFGYIYYLIPIILFLVTCLYLPFGLCIMYCFPQERISQRQEFIDTLNSKKIRESLLQRNPNEICSICMMEYEENQDVIALPCNENHFFHSTCIKSWLARNGVCPICRQKFAESFSEA